jgi:hypothetical protein
MLLGVMLPVEAVLCHWRKPVVCLFKDGLRLEAMGVYSVPWENG